jgi:CheY-like chemotaxis protein
MRREEDLHLVAVSGYGQPHDKDAARAAGFEFHLVKPVNMSELVGYLNRVREKKNA